MENNTAKHFVLQLGSLGSLYLSLAFLLVLLFGLINIIIPDAADNSWDIEGAQSMIRIGIAMVIVFFPTYLILTRSVNKLRRKETKGKYLGLTKWLIYLSLLVGGLVLLIDLVTVIMTFLEGEISERFVLKALSVLVVIGFAFFYYIKDAKGYWLKNEKQSVIFGAVTAIIVLAAVVAGGFNIDAPTEVREQKIDNQVVSDLQNIQWRVEDYYRTNEVLPNDLDELYGEFSVPESPDDRDDYTYSATGEDAYELCGEFSQDSTETDSFARPFSDKNFNWDYKAGNWCFERQIIEEIK